MPSLRNVSVIVYPTRCRVHSDSRTIDWESWLTQSDVDGMVEAKLNTIRIPTGFWIIEDIVDASHEPYAQGGLDELVSRVKPLG
jgi:hypothetical protein